MDADKNIQTVLEERGKTHGEFWLNALIMEKLLDVLRSSPHWCTIPYETRNAMTMTCAKLCRLVSEDGWRHEDNYVDIIGYNTLALESVRESVQFKREVEKEGHYL